MTRLFVEPRWPDGTHYELSLPDDWISKEDGDGERKFISHRSPSGARLVLWVNRRIAPGHKLYDPERDRSGIQMERAYTHAKWYACSRRSNDSLLMWLVCVVLGGIGPRPPLRREDLGVCRGFTFRIKSGKEAGWHGDFETESAWVRMAFWTGSANADAEIELARTAVSSFKFVEQ